ncbi:hypothetical protein A3Q56_02849 [Intoshia linei]|uniref:Uncharacterized protein n=1 Tax=Intoshia linei TaxID=1819745 RepID=A0A177B547_9BILA|nr:hypothetical protein A3Q56_02849 [Intoshia linei]
MVLPIGLTKEFKITPTTTLDDFVTYLETTLSQETPYEDVLQQLSNLKWDPNTPRLIATIKV